MNTLLVLLLLGGVASADTTVNQKGGVTAGSGVISILDGVHADCRQMDCGPTYYYSYEPQPVMIAEMSVEFPAGVLIFESYSRGVLYWRGSMLEVLGVW